MTTDNKNKKNKVEHLPVIVGIGASAGGLKALEKFFSNMQPNRGICFVVIQHLDPDHKSTLADILQRSTSINVKLIGDEEAIKADQIYVIPPGFNIHIEGKKIKRTKQEEPRKIPLSIDHFFRSLASNMQDRSVGIILSGTGSDGTLGLKEIKGANGMIMAQSPESAEHSGMPESAVGTELVDFVLPPEELPQKLLDYLSFLKNKIKADKEDDEEKPDEQLKQIFRLLKKETRHDFSQYKPSTILRRIERRIAVNALGSLSEYFEFLKEEDRERTALFKELLIGVTNFFRNKEAFKILESKVLPLRILQSRPYLMKGEKLLAYQIL